MVQGCMQTRCNAVIRFAFDRLSKTGKIEGVLQQRVRYRQLPPTAAAPDGGGRPYPRVPPLPTKLLGPVEPHCFLFAALFRRGMMEACLSLRKLRPLGLIAGFLLGLSVSMSSAGKVAGRGKVVGSARRLPLPPPSGLIDRSLLLPP